MKHIRLNRNHRIFPSATPIFAGDYDINDPALRGQGQWFVDNGFATVLWDSPEPEPEVVKVEVPDETEVSDEVDETDEPTSSRRRRRG